MLFGSSVRVKLLRAFFFNPEAGFSAAELAGRLTLAPSKVRAEIALLSRVGALRRSNGAKGARFFLDRRFPHYAALDRFIRDTTSAEPADLRKLIKQAGAFDLVALSGFFTGAAESEVDLLLVGAPASERTLARVIKRLEGEFGREIRYALFSTSDFRYRLGVYDRLIRDVFDYPHRLLLDKIGL
jgi:hypothetical protein